ncbi:heterokaryon incompatibility protein-domain-containing protein [Xylaria digitata]|nr:heterokaryon incompatibility protein-domain-containing protein [Xylaria digitata]
MSIVVGRRLCPTCAEIPFDASRPPFGAKGNNDWTHTHMLGTWMQIANRSCILCKLVVLAIQRIQQTEPNFKSISPDQEIGLWWVPQGDPKSAIRIVYNSQSRRSPMGTMIGAVLEPGTNNHYSFYTPVSATQIDFNKVRRWLWTCTIHHRLHCWNFDADPEARSLFSELRTIRFIDVNKGYLVERHSLCSYVCLSYVWGNVTSFRLSKANKSRFMRPGALMDVWDLLPKTIRDAVVVVRMLGEKYLWVDSLCLVQNDPQDIEIGTSAMDLIYEFSTLTIVAAGGRDASEGLSGVEAGSRFAEERIGEVIPGLRLAVYTHGDYRIEPTIYNSRAWTLQEYALSRKVLCFVDNQVFFRCRRNVFSEDSKDDGTPRWAVDSSQSGSSLSEILDMEIEIWSHPAMSYRIVIERYSRRMLTFSADVHNAMAGLMRRFASKMKCRFLEGMPTAVFDHFLTFRGDKSSLKRREGFPSYSWTGWIGPLTFWGTDPTAWDADGERHQEALPSKVESRWLLENTWIIWYERDPSGAISPVWDIPLTHSFPEGSHGYPGYRQRRSFVSQYQPGFPTSRTSPSNIFVEATILPSYQLLQFWTLSVYYKLSEIDAFTACATVVNREDMVLGSLNMNGFEETEFFDRTRVFEFIVLGKTPPRHPSPHMRPGKWYFVMCLEWKDGIAERRGIGDLSLDLDDLSDSFSPGPSWKEILLA